MGGLVSTTVAPRLRGRASQQARADLFRAHPYCVRCLGNGREIRATVRKHLVPLEEGGTEDPMNIAALCLDCAEAIHETERQRGVPAYGFTKEFQASARPRDAAGHFSVRRATRLQVPDADTPTPPRERGRGKTKTPAKATRRTTKKKGII